MNPSDDSKLRQRSTRTLAWLGDAEFEREVRLRLSRRGDYPTDRLDKLRARIVNAEAQAALLAELLDAGALREDELALVGRARNAAVRGGPRGRRNVRDYRAATALEALIAWWLVGGEAERFTSLISPAIEARIDKLMT
ncbi:Mini-ribonuclease 3 [Enhygromyxa salina]|uniref:Mini-ribonuclease 3 n=1 Tax=Enhygromyxa salina TaxID=215803 RepID=A0A2S9YJQ5_9BACT|nr:ribonuclease III domain-containing protein [Enhygromyxa salina]PRQ05343.1 Mini-ribonuclease 3 [Enhygromyxa salina]